jgi:hypothetical protein
MERFLFWIFPNAFAFVPEKPETMRWDKALFPPFPPTLRERMGRAGVGWKKELQSSKASEKSRRMQCLWSVLIWVDDF